MQTLLPALLTLHHEGRSAADRPDPQRDLGARRLLGLAAGRLTAGAPADLVLCDLDRPDPDRRRPA